MAIGSYGCCGAVPRTLFCGPVVSCPFFTELDKRQLIKANLTHFPKPDVNLSGLTKATSTREEPEAMSTREVLLLPVDCPLGSPCT